MKATRGRVCGPSADGMGSLYRSQHELVFVHKSGRGDAKRAMHPTVTKLMPPSVRVMSLPCTSRWQAHIHACRRSMRSAPSRSAVLLAGPLGSLPFHTPELPGRVCGPCLAGFAHADRERIPKCGSQVL